MGTIVELFRRNRQDRFATLLAPHIDYLFRLAYRFTGQRADAEDLVQDLLAKLYPRRGEIEQIELLRPWLARTLYHHFIDQVRRSERSPLHDAATLDALETAAVPAAEQPDSAAEADDLQRHLSTAMATLNPDQRALVALHDIEGYTLQELQTMLDTPLGTLKSRLHRARAALRSALNMEPFAPDQRFTGQRTTQ